MILAFLPEGVYQYRFIDYIKNVSPVEIDVLSTDLEFTDYVDISGSSLAFPVSVPANEGAIFIRQPKPEFYIGRINRTDATLVEVEFTAKLNDSIIPASSAFNLPSKTITDVSISENILTLTVSVAYGSGDDLSIGYNKPATNPLTAEYGSSEVNSFSESLADFAFVLSTEGDGSDVCNIRLEPYKEMDLSLDGTARFYSDAAGTLDESTTKTIPANIVTTIYMRCPSGTANLTLDNPKNLKRLYSWTAPTNGPNITGDVSAFSRLTYLFSVGKNTFYGSIEKIIFIDVCMVANWEYGIGRY
jgi:hypothetical protein